MPRWVDWVLAVFTVGFLVTVATVFIRIDLRHRDRTRREMELFGKVEAALTEQACRYDHEDS